MSTSRLLFRLKALLRRGRIEDDLSDELQFHLQNEIQKNIGAGMTPEEARFPYFAELRWRRQTREL